MFNYVSLGYFRNSRNKNCIKHGVFKIYFFKKIVPSAIPKFCDSAFKNRFNKRGIAEKRKRGKDFLYLILMFNDIYIKTNFNDGIYLEN